MKDRQIHNRKICIDNPNENWAAEQLKATGLKWTRQAQWGYRLFDFWNALKGIVVEVDGLSHKQDYD